MSRKSKQTQRRNLRKRNSKGNLGPATGPKKDNLPLGYKIAENAIPSSEPLSTTNYISRRS